MTMIIFYGALAVVASFMCSLLESVILSVTPAYINVSINKGKRSGRLLKKLKKNIDRPLAAVLTLNTVANMLGAAGVATEVHKLYGDKLVAGISLVLTLVVLIGSEIIPKILGATHWKTLAPACAYVIEVMIFALYPFVFLSARIAIFLGKSRPTQVTREEMIETAEIGALEGTIHEKERRVIKNVLMLDKIQVEDIMTPRSVVSAVSADDTVQELISRKKILRYSRIPVFKGDLDNVVGLLQRYKLLEASSSDFDDLKIESLMVPLHTVPDDISVAAVLDQFVKRKEHLFLVTDSYGTTVGIVTLEDAVETLLGVEIMDELDSIEDMRQLAREQWVEKKRRMAIPGK